MEKDTEIGRVYNRLTVVGRSETKTGFLRFSCACGRVVEIKKYNVFSGNTKSCGCATVALQTQASTKHGGSKDRIYWVWAMMKARCYNPKNNEYSNYGARGITVCKEWEDFAKFRSDMGPRPQGTSIERKDSNGNYSPDNCVWADSRTQSTNKRTSLRFPYKGVDYTIRGLFELSDNLGNSYIAIRARLSRGWTVERTLGTSPETPGLYLKKPRIAKVEKEDQRKFLYARLLPLAE